MWVVSSPGSAGRTRPRHERSDEKTHTTEATRTLKDLALRLRHMDERGVDVQVIYPTFFLSCPSDKPDIELELCRAYTRWMADATERTNGRLRWVVVPPYLSPGLALAEIESLEKKLDAGADPASSSPAPLSPWTKGISRIEVSQLEYTYEARSDGSPAFHIGPVDLTLNAGEVLFIVGGNGSGKSTFLKVLTGLYPASSGAIRVDGVAVTSRTSAAYRELICTIFTDFHLFSRLYGLLDVPSEAVQGLISQMELSEQTGYAEQRFTRRELSTGQRKRLAMIVALLEDRPIYVFDEWAADQDPVFRHYFYMELLPLLRQRGKTVIAVSHDDRYFRYADRVLTMEYGKVRSLEQHLADPASPPPKSP